MTKMSRATKYSTYLFSVPSLAESLSFPFDLAGAMLELNYLGEPGEINDLLAIAADWAAIGEDLKAAFADFAYEVDLDNERNLAILVLSAIISILEQKSIW